MKWRTTRLAGIFVTLLSSSLSAPAVAAEQSTDPDMAPAQGERTHLTGDWGGARSWLATHGIILDVQATQFYQRVVDGSPDNNWKYGVKGDYFLTVIGEKAGLWKGFILNLHAETRAGDDVNSLTGLSPCV